MEKKQLNFTKQTSGCLSMKEKIGEVFSIARDNRPIPACTVSKEIYSGEISVIYFSLAQNTDISAELYPCRKLLIAAEGSFELYTSDGESKTLNAGDAVLTEADVPLGIRTAKETVFTEISIWRAANMNSAVKAGEVFRLTELLPYQEGRIVNMDLIRNEKMKLVVMAFGEGTALSEHAAPGEALIFALDGSAVIGYEGVEHPIKAGENFHFAKGGLHSVKASSQFKMALLLTLEQEKQQ